MMPKKAQSSPASVRAFPGRKNDMLINVVIETPKGSQNKYKFDEELGMFTLSGVLPVGAVFPFDFGFVPGTLAEDGDPLDVLLLADSPAFPGCVIQARPLGVIQAKQTEKNRTERNDRLLAVASKSKTYSELSNITDIGEALREQIEHFFISYNKEKGKKFQVVGVKGAKVAMDLVRKSIQHESKKKVA